jgi:hypothetical protein
MSEQDSPVPLLDLAPKLKRSLRLWWPPDYLRLLYWVFFFPQAIRWYVDKFNSQKSDGERKGWRNFIGLLRIDSALRNLYIQGLVLTFTTFLSLNLGLQVLNIHVGQPLLITYGIVIPLGIGVILGISGRGARGVASAVALEIPSCILLVMLAATPVLLGGGLERFIMVLTFVGFMFLFSFITILMWLLFVFEGEDKFNNKIAFFDPLVIALLSTLLAAILLYLLVLMRSSRIVSPELVVWPLLAVFVATRLLDYALLFLPTWVSWHRHYRNHHLLGHVTWLPLPGIRHCLLDWLKRDSRQGVYNLNTVLEYSLQFIPVMNVIDAWFCTLSPEAQLVAADQLSQQPYDWNLVRFGSVSLRAAMWQEVLGGYLSIGPRRWRKRWVARFNAEPRLDMPARAACAGYWYLHEKEEDKAYAAFEQVRHLPYGEVLYQSAVALANAQRVEDLKAAAAWVDTTQWMAVLKEEPLRLRTVTTLQRLRRVALEAQVAIESISKLNRSAALGRAVSTLTEMIADVKNTCPDPEWPIVKQIAEHWRDVLSKAAGEIGQIAITRPVTNPYIVGNPVTGKVFVGREEVFQRLEELWGTEASLRVPSVVLYGHRRMGKTSILQNLGHRFGVNTIVTYVTMQRVGRVANTGELLTTFALALYDALSSAGIMTLGEPQSADFAGNGYAAFDRFLVNARRAIGVRRVILTIDEFELVERAINEKRVDAEVLDYLRGMIHSEPWLILALAGLHTLQEMTANYWNPLFASVTPVKVSFLTPGASAQLLANPADDFPLDFTQETADRVYAWVCGQPYLTQLVGHTLVRRYNQIVFEEGVARAPRFTPEDVDAVVDSPEFYEQGSYYFTGVWQQAEESGPRGQITLMRALAAIDEPQGPTALFERAGLDDIEGQASLDKLLKHDVVRQIDAVVDFAVPLMRKWLKMRSQANGRG